MTLIMFKIQNMVIKNAFVFSGLGIVTYNLQFRHFKHLRRCPISRIKIWSSLDRPSISRLNCPVISLKYVPVWLSPFFYTYFYPLLLCAVTLGFESD